MLVSGQIAMMGCFGCVYKQLYAVCEAEEDDEKR